MSAQGLGGCGIGLRREHFDVVLAEVSAAADSEPLSWRAQNLADEDTSIPLGPVPSTVLVHRAGLDVMRRLVGEAAITLDVEAVPAK